MAILLVLRAMYRRISIAEEEHSWWKGVFGMVKFLEHVSRYPFSKWDQQFEQ
jgi:hypothetical protein